MKKKVLHWLTKQLLKYSDIKIANKTGNVLDTKVLLNQIEITFHKAPK